MSEEIYPNDDPATGPETAAAADAAAPQGGRAACGAGPLCAPDLRDGGVRKLTGIQELVPGLRLLRDPGTRRASRGRRPETVQRRILHAMKVIDDGRYNKVANIVGQTMQYHPHGDASIKDALVQLGQKDLLIGLARATGATSSRATRRPPAVHIEARLSKFALDVVFNKKTTEGCSPYDGRKEEPVTLPVTSLLLLAQGADGIAVGLASKILPHNFNELIHAAVAHLRGETFQLYPDFPTGGMIDVALQRRPAGRGGEGARQDIEDRQTDAGHYRNSLYDDHRVDQGVDHQGQREGQDQDPPRGRQHGRAREIIVQVAPDESSDKTIDALYAFTDCEVSISPNACVIRDEKPHFMGVSEILRRSADHIRGRCWGRSSKSGCMNSTRRGTPLRSNASSSRTSFTSSSRDARPARRPTRRWTRGWRPSRSCCAGK